MIGADSVEHSAQLPVACMVVNSLKGDQILNGRVGNCCQSWESAVSCPGHTLPIWLHEAISGAHLSLRGDGILFKRVTLEERGPILHEYTLARWDRIESGGTTLCL